MRLVRRAELTPQPWRNGGGVTWQIAAGPDGADGHPGHPAAQDESGDQRVEACHRGEADRGHRQAPGEDDVQVRAGQGGEHQGGQGHEEGEAVQLPSGAFAEHPGALHGVADADDDADDREPLEHPEHGRPLSSW